MEWIKWNILSSDAMSSSQQPSQPQQTSATVLSGAADSQLIARLREAQQNNGGANVQLAGGINSGTIKIQVSFGSPPDRKGATANKRFLPTNIYLSS